VGVAGREIVLDDRDRTPRGSVVAPGDRGDHCLGIPPPPSTAALSMPTSRP
jgi:hypothetical protein